MAGSSEEKDLLYNKAFWRREWLCEQRETERNDVENYEVLLASRMALRTERNREK